jgi:hypothetical protein
MEPIWPSYQPFLSHQDEDIRAWALRRMSRAAPKEALVVARTLLEGPSTKVTKEAAHILAQHMTSEDQSLLQRRLQEPLDDLERLWLLKALSDTKAYQNYYTNEPTKTLLLRSSFWEQWATLDPEACTRAILAQWDKKPYKNEEQAWVLAEHSAPTSAARLLKELRGLEEKDTFAVVLSRNAGAEDLFAEAPSTARDHARSCLLLLEEELGMPSVTAQEQKAFAAIKKKNWENAIKLALSEAPQGEPAKEWRCWRSPAVARPRPASPSPCASG